jgi:alcohol dehydrogenase (cytochrome c)
MAALAAAVPASAQVSSDRLRRAADEPQNWLTYSGGYASQRYSPLRQIDGGNVKNLELKWVLPNQVFGAWQATPLVVDGIMYVTQRPNDVLAVDAKTGRVFWQYRYTVSPEARVCCGANNRGLAILGSRLFMGTLDGRLVAIDATGGRPLWNVPVGDPRLGYSITMAPLAVKDKILVGVGGGEYGIRGFVAAYDPATGKELWRFYTVPGPGERGHETWKNDAWKTGGGSVWVTPSYDPALNLTYWGIGNPGPDWNADLRPGDNLFTDSVIALDADTGALKWHFQFTPNDTYDYDSVQMAVLADVTWRGTPTKAMFWANRNGFFYVLNRETGAFLAGAPFVKVNWASGLDANGRPMPTPHARGCSTCRRGKATRRSSGRSRPPTFPAATSSAAATRC